MTEQTLVNNPPVLSIELLPRILLWIRNDRGPHWRFYDRTYPMVSWKEYHPPTPWIHDKIIEISSPSALETKSVRQITKLFILEKKLEKFTLTINYSKEKTTTEIGKRCEVGGWLAVTWLFFSTAETSRCIFV